MPELPEVETLVSSMKNAGLEGASFTSVYITYHKCIHLHTPSTFKSLIINSKISKIYRKGKYIVFELSNKLSMLVHLRMTGHFFLADKKKEVEKHEHIQFELDKNKILSYFDTRKFGKIYLVNDPQEIFDKLGPDPLDKDFDYIKLLPKIFKSNKQIKALLLDQSFMTGLGNIYVDEVLWESHIHPSKISNSLSEDQLKKLFSVIKKVLQQGIKNKGTSLGDNSFNFSDVFHNFGNNQNHLNAYMKFNKPCKRCKTLINKMKIAQRTSYFCPECQK